MSRRSLLLLFLFLALSLSLSLALILHPGAILIQRAEVGRCWDAYHNKLHYYTTTTTCTHDAQHSTQPTLPPPTIVINTYNNETICTPVNITHIVVMTCTYHPRAWNSQTYQTTGNATATMTWMESTTCIDNLHNTKITRREQITTPDNLLDTPPCITVDDHTSVIVSCQRSEICT